MTDRRTDPIPTGAPTEGSVHRSGSHLETRPIGSSLRETSRRPTGIQTLDLLLQGGLPARSLTIVHGPSFLGADVLARQVIRSSLAQGVPVVSILTRTPAAAAREGLFLADQSLAGCEREGLLRFVDTTSRSIDAAQADDHVVYTDSVEDLGGLIAAFDEARTGLVKDPSDHLVVMDSLSPLVLHNNLPDVYRSVQTLTGKARRAGATVLMIMDDGMHEATYIHAIRHLCDGSFVLRREKDRTQIRIEGLGVVKDPGWLDYRSTPTDFEITGTLAGGRIG